MSKMIIDLTKAKNKTEVENITRAKILHDIEEFLISKYEGAIRVGATEFAFPAAIADSEGFTVDVAAIVSVKIPKFYDVEHKDTDKPTTKRYEVINYAYQWASDPKSEKKMKKETEWVKMAEENMIESDPIEYDFEEIDEDSFE